MQAVQCVDRDEVATSGMMSIMVYLFKGGSLVLNQASMLGNECTRTSAKQICFGKVRSSSPVACV